MGAIGGPGLTSGCAEVIRIPCAGDFREWWEAYLRTYVERDLPALGIGAEPILLRRLLTMLAHQQGGIVNSSRLGAALGVSNHTITRYMDVLEQTYLLRRLPPYFCNVGKRLVKAPKAYLRDSGLVHHLLNITTADDLDSHPIRGASWETFVLEDVIRRERLEHPQSQFFYWRTAAGAEIDLVIDRGSERFAIEIKSARADKPKAIHALESAAADVATKSATFIDQDKGLDRLRPNIDRRGFDEAIHWLP
jgi:uncharacterized protein